ncbi:MAG TPA: UpxY family transcription antiterminator [Bacteroidales bacterium]|nr:UpxY family transcription antiterminator [Bacteroidales bacterium]
MANIKWYALYTKSRTEKRVHKELVDKGIETYLPLEKRLKQWSDRKKWVEEPFIRSYIFVKTTLPGLQKALNTPGVVTVIRFSGEPAPVQEKEITLIQRVLNSDEEYEVTADTFALGEKVKVEHGSLKNLEGELVQHLNKYKVLVRIASINQNILIRINPSYLKKV